MSGEGSSPRFVLLREGAVGVREIARNVGRVIRHRFGPRARFFHLDDWTALENIGALELDHRREISISFRVSGELAGNVMAREGAWFRAQLRLPVEDEQAATCFEELIAAARPEKAACGREITDYVSTLTFRLQCPDAVAPQGVQVTCTPPGWLFACTERLVPQVVAWLALPSAPPRPPISAPIAFGPLGIPTYLRAPPAGTPAPDETVLGASPRGPALPFQAPAPLPPPPPGAQVFDPDVTLPPVPVSNPTLPFSGKTTPERLEQIAGSPRLEPAADAGETAILPVADDVRALVMAALQDKDDLPLEEYAALRALLMSHGEDDRSVLLRFGLTKATKEKVQQRYFERFRAEPALRERFEALLREEVRKNHRMKEDP